MLQITRFQSQQNCESCALSQRTNKQKTEFPALITLITNLKPFFSNSRSEPGPGTKPTCSTGKKQVKNCCAFPLEIFLPARSPIRPILPIALDFYPSTWPFASTCARYTYQTAEEVIQVMVFDICLLFVLFPCSFVYSRYKFCVKAFVCCWSNICFSVFFF